ncbi:hypothetical protein [Streptomyces sp. Je 1-369]|uniref:hypothetical protein n=1 Tax=Streptomyces sp. Je 1-369 TaxID=2966192 RepID=UPI0022859A34|nr:hypothetical protein [Streptomyces sp. Je 1-369]WAL99664.1 hypothetical protein NOO62_37460 [Streptomyces sp. Je 1-369]
MRRRRTVWRAWSVALVLGALFCGFSGWTYAQTRADADLAYARDRDGALDAARRHIAVLNTMDGKDVRGSLRAWAQAADGPLADELRRTGDAGAGALEQEGTTTRATVTDAAVVALDTRAGTAKVIASVRVEVAERTGKSTTDRKRFEAGLDRKEAGWKLGSLTAVPVGTVGTG